MMTQYVIKKLKINMSQFDNDYDKLMKMYNDNAASLLKDLEDKIISLETFKNEFELLMVNNEKFMKELLTKYKNNFVLQM